MMKTKQRQAKEDLFKRAPKAVRELSEEADREMRLKARKDWYELNGPKPTTPDDLGGR